MVEEAPKVHLDLRECSEVLCCNYHMLRIGKGELIKKYGFPAPALKVGRSWVWLRVRVVEWGEKNDTTKIICDIDNARKKEFRANKKKGVVKERQRKAKPAIRQLRANLFRARELHTRGYRQTIRVGWIPTDMVD